MKRNLLYALFAAVLLGMALDYAVNVGATPANGFTATTLAKGTLGSFEVFNHFVPPIVSEESEEDDKKIWLSWQKTKGESDLYVQSNVWASGGSTGWHSHPGHSLIIVTAGTLTVKTRAAHSCSDARNRSRDLRRHCEVYGGGGDGQETVLHLVQHHKDARLDALEERK